jgi:hypothetical protein
MTSASERFVLAMVRACLPETESGIRFDYGSRYMHQSMEHPGEGARSGVMSIKIDGVDPSIHVEYSLLGAGDGVTWTEGRCTIRLGNDRDRAWEFYCEEQDNGLLRVRTMAVMRQCRALKRAVQSALTDLGGNAEAIARQLQKLGCAPDIEGLKSFVGGVFALVDVEIINVMRHGSSLPEIRGRRTDKPELELKLYNPSGAIGRFISQQLSAAC